VQIVGFIICISRTIARYRIENCSLDICITTYIEYFYTFRSARVHHHGIKPNQSLLCTADVQKSQMSKMQALLCRVV